MLGDHDLGAACIEIGDQGISAIRALLSKAVSAISAPKASPSMSGGTPTVSKRCPGKSTKRTRLPSASVSARWWSGRLWSGRWPGSESPFCALPVAVDFDNGRVHHGVFPVGLVRDGGEQPLPDVRPHPIAEADEDAVPVPERTRQIAPWTARADNPQHRLDKKPVVLAAAPRITGLAQTTRLHLRPLGVRQHKASHPRREPQPSTDENRESQQALVRCGFPQHGPLPHVSNPPLPPSASPPRSQYLQHLGSLPQH